MNEKQSISEIFGEKSRDGKKLDPSTLEEISWMNRGEGADILYQILNAMGDTTYIHKYLNMLPTEPNRSWMGNMTRMDIEQNPTFSDTLSKKEGMERLAPQEGFLKSLLKKLGY